MIAGITITTPECAILKCVRQNKHHFVHRTQTTETRE